MKLDIRLRHLSLSPEDLAELRHRVLVALAPLRAWVRTVHITLSDINGPKGGADKRCRLRLRGRSLPGIVIDEVGGDTRATVTLAVYRAEQALVRKMARRRGVRRVPNVLVSF